MVATAHIPVPVLTRAIAGLRELKTPIVKLEKLPVQPAVWLLLLRGAKLPSSRPPAPVLAALRLLDVLLVRVRELAPRLEVEPEAVEGVDDRARRLVVAQLPHGRHH